MWGYAPSEFWRLTPAELWWLIESKNPNTEDKWESLYRMID